MEACRELSALGSEAVLLKGGHAEERSAATSSTMMDGSR